jgi:hypothetical protein
LSIFADADERMVLARYSLRHLRSVQKSTLTIRRGSVLDRHPDDRPLPLHLPHLDEEHYDETQRASRVPEALISADNSYERKYRF